MVSIDDVVRDFRLAAMEKGDAGGALDDALYDRLRACFQQLVALGEAGRTAFAALLTDPSPSVRGWVAAELLVQGDARALPVLRELVREGGFAGFNASMVVREFEKGTLKSPFRDSAA